MESEPRELPDSELPDSDLLAAHVAGDAEAFGILFARHRDRLWAVALRTCSDPETAADGLQEGVIAAFRRASSYRGDAQVTTWLHRIVVNACLDRLRSAKVRRAESLPENLDEQASSAHTTVGDSIDPAEASVALERRDRVRAALATLPVEQRAAVVLVDMEGYPVAEVARILDCAEGTVKSRCSRGRARLAGLLADVLHDGEDAAVVAPAAARDAVPGNPAADPHVGPLATRGPPPAGAPTTD